MTRAAEYLTVTLLLTLLSLAAAPVCAQATDDEPAQPHQSGSTTELTAAQRDSAGIAIGHAAAASLPAQVTAFGQVLDPASLVAEQGQVQAAQVAERTAAADLKRLQGLYKAEASSSLRMVQTAEAEQTRAHSQYRAALATFTEHWGRLARLPAGQLEQLIDHASSGTHLLVRASLLGQQSVGALPQAAWLEVDGVKVAAQVLDVLPQGASEVQGAALLLEVTSPPRGLGPGARVPVTLLYNAQRGVVLPAAAVLYTEHGAYVYRQSTGNGAGRFRFAAVPVELLQRVSAGWLMRGVDAEDLIVVQGAGALWSLSQQPSSSAAADDDD
ncbi:MAG: hypothetical protein JOY91_08565 [Sinobacteraceae bacterium]|nr:hypothetical protein [Nevskiaceae bacterium]